MPIPEGPHNDWQIPWPNAPEWLKKLWPFQYIPRSLNAWQSDVPPVQIFGNVPEGNHLDVPAPGQWTVAGYKDWKIPVLIAWQTKNQQYYRIGLIRYDYVDRYYTALTGTKRDYRTKS